MRAELASELPEGSQIRSKQGVKEPGGEDVMSYLSFLKSG